MYIEEAARFSQLMTALGELYGKPLTEALHEIYWLALESYSLEDIQKAIARHVHNPDCGQFMPKPADLIRALEGDTESQSKLAWSKVEKALKHHGPYQTVVFDDPYIHAVISDMGGWVFFGSVTDIDWKFMAQDFEKRYRAYAQNPTSQFPPKLIGMAESHNRIIHKQIPEPILIGDSAKARKILETGNALSKPETSKPMQQVMLKVISRPQLQGAKQEGSQ